MKFDDNFKKNILYNYIVGKFVFLLIIFECSFKILSLRKTIYYYIKKIWLEIKSLIKEFKIIKLVLSYLTEIMKWNK